jgi:hypothetical protein
MASIASTNTPDTDARPPNPAGYNSYAIAATVSGSTARLSVTIERENGRFRLLSAVASPDIH